MWGRHEGNLSLLLTRFVRAMVRTGGRTSSSHAFESSQAIQRPKSPSLSCHKPPTAATPCGLRVQMGPRMCHLWRVRLHSMATPQDMSFLGSNSFLLGSDLVPGYGRPAPESIGDLPKILTGSVLVKQGARRMLPEEEDMALQRWKESGAPPAYLSYFALHRGDDC